jgi:hypothetical protein
MRRWGSPLLLQKPRSSSTFSRDKLQNPSSLRKPKKQRQEEEEEEEQEEEEEEKEEEGAYPKGSLGCGTRTDRGRNEAAKLRKSRFWILQRETRSLI